MSTLADRRERARRLATGIVSVAIAALGVTLVVFAVMLVVRGGPSFLLLSVVLFALGAFLAALGFFFQLVPLKLQELAEGKREHDRRAREAAERDGDARQPGRP